MAKLITLLTDFGLEDGYPGIMKGVILGIASDAQIVDITHLISPQNILEGALALSRAAPYFPPGTVHIAVVDPGVGTARRPIAARLGIHWFVAPDNGLLTLVHQQARQRGEPAEFVHLNQPRYWLPKVSPVFHGRDIFAPVGAHLANGTPLHALGTPISDPLQLHFPQPEPLQEARGWRGQIIAVDHFGNLVTNISAERLEGSAPLRVRFKQHTIKGLSRTFGDGHPGQLVALIDSADYLSLCLVNGSAQQATQAQIGDGVVVERQDAAAGSF